MFDDADAALESNRLLNLIIMNKKCFKAIKPLIASRWRDHDPSYEPECSTTEVSLG